MEDRHKQIDDLIDEGLSQFYIWNNSKAEEIFLKALALDPDNAQIIYQLGSACFYQNRVDESLEYYKKAVLLSPNDAHYHFVFGFALMTQNDLKEAADELERSIEIESSNIQAHKNLGEIYYLLGNYKKSVISFTIAAEKNPYPENYLNQYISLRMSGGKEAALDFLTSSSKNIYKDDPLYLVMRLYLGYIDTDTFIEKIGERLMPCTLFYHCGMRLLFDGNQHKACEFFKKSIETKCTYISEYRRAQHELDACGK